MQSNNMNFVKVFDICNLATNEFDFSSIVQVYNDNQSTVSIPSNEFNFSSIVVISGHLASRCINFMDKEYRWHLTDEYLDPSSTMNCVDLIHLENLWYSSDCDSPKYGVMKK